MVKYNTIETQLTENTQQALMLYSHVMDTMVKILLVLVGVQGTGNQAFPCVMKVLQCMLYSYILKL